jgi:hypothetical protein
MLFSRDIGWAAGFLEGEGYFSWNRTAISVQASQVQREPLDRLQMLFGGRINGPYSSKNQNPYFRWSLCGTRAAEVCMTLFVLMSPKRKEKMASILAEWRSRAKPGVGNRGKTMPRSWSRRPKIAGLI